jgi:pimeloyl-ACP methyl ester carboxylesterase
MSAIFKTEEGKRAVHERYAQMLAYWPVPNEHLRLPTREGETFVVACGPKDAPALMLFHGAQANAATWMGDVPAWSQTFRVYAVDVIGDVGFSAPSRPPMDSEAHALWIDDVMAGLGVAEASLVGMSLGGWLALDYATRRPARARALVLLCPAGIGAQKNFLAKVWPLLLLGPWGARKIGEMVFGPLRGEPSPAQAAFGAFLALINRSVRRRIVKIPVVGDEALARLTMPVMAVVGGKDVLIDSDGTRRRLRAAVPRAEVRYLPDAYHLLPSQTAEVLTFLQAAQAGRRSHG